MNVIDEARTGSELAIDAALDRLCAGQDLAADQTEHLFSRLARGEMAEAEIAGLLVGLKAKGECSDELVGAARALRAAAVPFPRPDYLFADTCGTGGDRSGTINVSTAVAFVAAACGLPVVKHGNRSITSRCGSVDVLERLGARIDLPPETSRHILDETGICFLFAPQYHPALVHAAAVRRMLKVRTIFNVLGPCLNPALPPMQLVGVADPALVEPVARALQALGAEMALVVHGAGIDEVALHGTTTAARVGGSGIETLSLTPEDFGLERAPLEALAGGDPDENARRLRAVLGGGGSPAERNMVAINAGALLFAAGLAEDYRIAAEAAQLAMSGGLALARLDAFVEASNA